MLVAPALRCGSGEESGGLGDLDPVSASLLGVVEGTVGPREDGLGGVIELRQGSTHGNLHAS